MPDENLRQAVFRQRNELSNLLRKSMSVLGQTCASMMGERDRLEEELAKALVLFGNCKHLFVLDGKGCQIVDNITHEGRDPRHFGRDRSNRPYVSSLFEPCDFHLSDAYISQNSKRPMLTAVQAIRNQVGKRIGLLGADFDLRELPATKDLYQQTGTWRQIKGDPAIRGGLFAQERVQSVMDDHLDIVLALMCELMAERGVFHSELYFSANRATVWSADDPQAYRIFDIDELIDPNIVLAHPARSYPGRAMVPCDDIMPVFEMFRELRFVDETIYLRSGSLNLISGLVALNFSCDGSHFLPCSEFLDRGIDFWLS